MSRFWAVPSTAVDPQRAHMRNFIPLMGKRNPANQLIGSKNPIVLRVLCIPGILPSTVWLILYIKLSTPWKMNGCAT